jgi:hypothetical protein
MKNILATICIVISLGLVIAGCKGDTGPAGPQGNANVKVRTYSVSSSQWVNSTSTTPYEYYVDLTDQDITQSIINNGAVLVYIENSSGGWYPLPSIGYAQSNGGADLEYKLSPVYSLSTVTVLYYIVSNPNYWIPANPGAQTFKVIVIAGSLQSSANINWNNYEEVKKAFNLHD